MFYFRLGAATYRTDLHLQLTTQGKPAVFNGQLANPAMNCSTNL